MDIVDRGGWLRDNHAIYRGYGVFHFGGVFIPTLFWKRPPISNLGINRFDQADIAIGWWWVQSVHVLLSTVNGVW